MQRKNSLLRKPQKSTKSGMAIMIAIIVIVILSTIMAISLSMTTQTSKKTTDLYLYEQASILSRSAAEYAVLKASLANPCSISNIDFRYIDTYDINISMKYVAFSGSNCDTNTTSATLFSNTTATESDGTIVMDITVTANPSSATEPIRYFRRTIQKL